MQSTTNALLTAITLVVFCGPAFAIDFSNYPSHAEASVRLGVRHWTTGVPVYDDNDVFGQYDFTSGTNPSASASGSGSPAPVYNPGDPIGTFSGSASATAQSLKASISTPSTPSDWTATSAEYTLGQTARAKSYDWLYYPGNAGEIAQLTMHYDITGSINFSDNSFSGSRPNTLVEMYQFNPVSRFMDTYEIFSSNDPSTWIGGDFYSYHSFNIGFDFIIDIEIEAMNEMVSDFLIYTDFEVPGAPGVTMDFSNTANYYVKELRELTIEGENRILDSELPLFDPSTGALLLESASGTNYAVPIPGAVWLLGSGLIGLFGFRKKFKK